MDEFIPLLVLGILAIPILIVIVLLIVYIAKTNKLASQTSALSAEVAALRKELSLPGGSRAALEYDKRAQPEPIPAVQSAQPASDPSVEAEIAPPPSLGPQITSSSVTTSGRQQPAGPEVYVSPSRTRAEWESLIGGRLLNWIGALAIIIGIAFFLGYGYENNWISPALLVAIGAFAGLVLLAGGDLSFRKGYSIFSQGLIGAGISILYLSVYASFNYFHLQSQTNAFLMMCSVTVLAFIQAFRFNSLSVSLLGWAGGFLTPLLVSTGEANEVALFAYIMILDAGLLAVVAFKDNWVVLQPLTLGATYALYILWYANYYDSAKLATTAAWLTVFWGLFHALDIVQIVRPAKEHLALRETVAVLNALCYYGALYVIVDEAHHDYLATVTLGLGAAYLITIAAIRRLHPPRVTEARFALTGAILLVIATALRFSGLDTVFCWSMEALALVLAAIYWKEPGVLLGALLLYLAAVIKLPATAGWYSYGTPESFVPLLNKRVLAFLGLAAAGGLAAEVIRRGGRGSNKNIATFFDYSCWLVLFVLIALEVQDEFGHLLSNGGDPEWLQFAMYLAIGVAWMVYGLALTRYRTERGLSPPLDIGLFVTGASIFTVAIGGFSYKPIADFRLFTNIRFAAFAVDLIGLLILLRWSAEPKKWPRWSHGAFLSIFCLMILVLCTAETRDNFARLLDPMHQQYGSDLAADQVQQALLKYTNLQQVSLSLVWLIYSILLIGYGIWRRILSLRIIAIAIFGIAILKIFIYDLRFLETLYRIFSFIGLGLILLSVSFLYQRFKGAILESSAGPEPGVG